MYFHRSRVAQREMINHLENKSCLQIHPHLYPLSTLKVPAIVIAAASQGMGEAKGEKEQRHMNILIVRI
jgi:hypothetical protein